MKKLPLLPDNPDKESRGRFPKWLHRTLPKGLSLWKTHAVLDTYRLPTVCEEARCPNLPECYAKKTATFLAMGKECTRSCGFCDIDFSKTPKALEADEPARLAASVKALGLKHVVITMVARDDLLDGGSAHLKQIVEEVRNINPGVTIELLTSDFNGNQASLETVLQARPDIFNHNIETVRRLTPQVRSKATYERTLATLEYVKKRAPNLFVKSGIMLGLGETEDEVRQTLQDLHGVGCDIVTIGHYLQPSRKNLRVKTFVEPSVFDAFAAYGEKIGIPHVYAGPFVRSSYNADNLFNKISTWKNHS